MNAQDSMRSGLISGGHEKGYYRMTTPHHMRRLAAVSLLALSLATFAPVGLSLAGAAGDNGPSKNTGQTAKPDPGGNRGEQQGDGHGVKAGESLSNDDHAKATADNNAKAADDANAAKDVDSPGCAFGNNQKNGQLATAPGCTKDDSAKAKVDDEATGPADQPQVVTAAPNQIMVATPAQPITIVVTTPITTPSGIIPAGTTITILTGTIPLSGQVEGATISAPGVPDFAALPFTVDTASATIQQAPESQVAAADIPAMLPQTGGGHGELQQ